MVFYYIDPLIDLAKVYLTINVTVSGRIDEYTFPPNLSKDTHMILVNDGVHITPVDMYFKQNQTVFVINLLFRHDFKNSSPIAEGKLAFSSFITFDSDNRHYHPDGFMTSRYNFNFIDKVEPIPEISSTSTSFEDVSVDFLDD